MIKVVYTTAFIRMYDDLHPDLKGEVRERIALFQKDPRHPSLRTHKLKGALAGQFSFSVNYQYRIVFYYDDKHTVALLAVGDHDIYR